LFPVVNTVFRGLFVVDPIILRSRTWRRIIGPADWDNLTAVCLETWVRQKIRSLCRLSDEQESDYAEEWVNDGMAMERGWEARKIGHKTLGLYLRRLLFKTKTVKAAGQQFLPCTDHLKLCAQLV
jgi:hypothetical protein